jgi:hypothetical protein
MADETVKTTVPPFQRGETVRALVNDGRLLREGKRYRVLGVRPETDCGSGWMVDVGDLRRGPIRRDEAPYGSMDSDNFEWVSTREGKRE